MIEVRPRGELGMHEIADAERELGTRLPEQYRRWLQSTGGGPTVDDYEVPEVDGGFGTFVGLAGDYRLTTQYVGFDELLPRDLIRIAYGDGGTVAIKVAGEDVGSIWWSDHDHADALGAEVASYEYVTKLADDFDSFLDRW